MGGGVDAGKGGTGQCEARVLAPTGQGDWIIEGAGATLNPAPGT